MKTKLTSLILILSMVLSMFTVFSFADNTATASEESTNKVKEYLHYRNSFGDGNDDLGGTLILYNASKSSIEVKAENNGNKYGYYTFNDSASNVFFQFAPNSGYTISTEKQGYLIFEMDFNDFGKMITTDKFLEIHSGDGNFAPTGGRVAAGNILNVANNGGENYFYFNNNKTNKITIPSNQWVHIRLELSILSSSATEYNFRAYIGDKYFEKTYELGSPTIIKYIRIGSTNSTNQSFGLDNITAYSAPENLPTYEDIGSISKALIMKVGAENAKINNQQIELSYTPLLINGKVYIPRYILETYTSKSCPSQYVTTFDGLDYVFADDVISAFAVPAIVYDMGLIVVAEEKSQLESDTDYQTIMDIMKGFVFNLPTASELKSDVKSYTNNYEHPYILADSQRFAELKAIYESGKNGLISNSEEQLLYSYINQYVTSAVSSFKSFTGSDVNASYTGILANKIPVNNNYNNYNNNGYDVGGRVSNIVSSSLYQWAFAYQMTGNLNYARLAYDYMLALGEWNHWGPAHFLNCADAAAPFAIAYDWFYNAFKQLNSNNETSKFSGETIDNQKMVDILFRLAIVPGYIQSNKLSCPWPGSVNSSYSTTTNNWNAVCTSGMMAAALAIIGEETPTTGMTFVTQIKSGETFTNKTVSISEIGNAAIHVGLSTYSDYAAKLASMNMNSLMRYGLGEYAPDGSYIESPGYWSYGTNTFFRMVATLMTATGDDYGFMDTWGMDTTCYFAIHSESSDYKTWNYNDGSTGPQDSSYFFFVGNFYEDDNLIKVRKKQMASGKSYTLYDILFYDTTIVGEPELATEYVMTGIDGYAVRSSWDKGALYAAIMGGPNQVSHGHLDGGAFIYQNNGKIWFADLGSDNYNIVYTNKNGQSKGYFSNFELYRIGGEGHNIMLITSEQSTLPYGQLADANPPLVETYSTVDGGYSIIDLSSSYGNHVISAKRGMLFTDSRSTVVIQDEVTFNGKKTAYWFGHYNIAPGYIDSVSISADGRTAFMTSGDDILRVSIVSDNKDLTFEIMDCYTYLLDVTLQTDRDHMDEPRTENNRDSFGKLAIKCENVETLNLAVVIESVSAYKSGTDYTWCNMDSWSVESSNNFDIDTNFKADFESPLPEIGNISFVTNEDLYKIDGVSSTEGSYIQIYSANSGTSSSDATYNFTLKGREDILLARDNYFVMDFDVFTESSFIDKSAIGFNIYDAEGNKEFLPIISFSDGNMIAGGISIPSSGEWNHVTIIVDGNDKTAHVFVNNTFKAKISGIPTKLLSTSFCIEEGSVSARNSSVSFDNVQIRTFGLLYENAMLVRLLIKHSSLSYWNDAVSYTHTYIPLAVSNGNYLYTVSEIESAIENGYSVDMLRDCITPISINNATTVNTNGYVFNYISTEYLATVKDDTITFATGSITVIWHIGLATKRETYSASTVASFKGTDKSIGVIREEIITYADGTIGFKYYTTGWARTKGGAPLTAEEMIVTSENCEFWLVNNQPLECAFVIEDKNGAFKPYNDEVTLRNELSNNTGSKKIVLCDDVELKGTSVGGIAIATEGKNLYLNGYTLSHNVYDVHTFIFRYGAKGNFNIYGHGSLKMTDTRTIFTSDSGTTYTTSTNGYRLTNVDIYINSQLADVRVGQHVFTNCNIYQDSGTKAKTLVDIWNKNTGMVNGAPLNLVTVTFNGCNILKNSSTSSQIFSFAASCYAEYYVNSSTIKTNGVIAYTLNPNAKVYIAENSSIIATGITTSSNHIDNLTFAVGVKTNLELTSDYIPAGAVITDNQSVHLPYCIATNYATVRWLSLDGEIISEAKLAIGATPRINEVVRQYLSDLNKSGVVYHYSDEVISSTGIINLTPIITTPDDILHGMRISDNFALEIYIPAHLLDYSIDSVTIDGVLLCDNAYEETVVTGYDYYKHRITSIDVSRACENHTVLINYKNGTTKTISISVVSYLDNLLSTSVNTDEAVLAYKLLAYIKSAYDYRGKTSDYEYVYLASLIDNYSQYNIIFGEMADDYNATADMRHAISSVRLHLSSSVRFRFTFNPEYTGRISISYLGKTTTYYVNNGMLNNKNYIEAELLACHLNSDIVISDGTSSITYNINSYFTSLGSNDPTLTYLAYCLSEYSSAAKKYVG